MNWDAIGAIGEILGAIGVIATLGYLSMQIRQNTTAVKASAYQSITEHLAEINRAVVEDPEMSDLSHKGATDLNSLSARDQARFGAFVVARLRHYENIYYHHQKNLIESEVWDAHENVLRGMMKNPGVRLAWSNAKAGFPKSFSQAVDKIAEGSE